jgi:chemotaxis protein methyltransferase CheR
MANDADYFGFCRMVRSRTGLDLEAYKRQQMERRVRAMADRHGIGTLMEYWQHLSRNPEDLRIFMDKVTINVSEFFRNPEKFEELRTLVFPELLRKHSRLLIWSAGCSYGAEPYTLRILLHQVNPGIRHRIFASDIDTGVLERARQGRFLPDDLRNISDILRERYFIATANGYEVKAFLRDGIDFQRHDLLRDPFPHNVDLILCRNVVIYFNEETKQRLYERYYAALRPGGYLLVGSTERISNAREIGFVSTRPFFYHKPA